MRTQWQKNTPASPTQKRGWQTRNKLIRAATKLFSEKGYEATTTNQISKRAGVSVGIFYKYFRDKRDIFLGIYRDYSEEIAKKTSSDLNPATWRSADIRAAIRAHIWNAYESHKVDPGLQHAFAHTALKDPEFLEVRNQIRVSVRDSLVRILEENRDMVGPANIRLAAFIIDESVEACIHQKVFFDVEFNEDDLVNELAAMVSSYLSQPSA